MNPDKRAQHAPSTQSDPGRSTLHADANALMREFAGRGRVVAGSRPGVSGTKETFDTGDRVIGVYRQLDGREALTTRGTIHYSKTGAHIVPAQPNGWVN
ncbi:polymorphic toxin type 50 domain-containing protein [Teichococcus aerophilus]|uniref:polymorphic toxin type 50 domain-containing protein n=1 Tax=Teichococcus aerophilus TaxID=1224513 RepID=UPI0034633D89